ncbi:exodeoxyribonuclease VII small subunit [Methanofollis aquaemaris]|uniref:Exodeoxyribonuclease VII small subunit n=1 Tax=Methanofollis aquaemaris TaxID=126734 RepID=A0A8A3S4F4_9EURY|nr:exodeoxyribonuclease VII small subunit [Methanofollis aquaemaris]QSZ66749.1 exodeoxyribonuclease VII small subunit [Methanofollis aquaemaris]
MKKTYEDLIHELKETIKKIEDDSTGLEESIALYEKGEELVRECERLLDEAEVRVTTLTQG